MTQKKGKFMINSEQRDLKPISQIYSICSSEEEEEVQEEEDPHKNPRPSQSKKLLKSPYSNATMES